ncbi:hypothetical protein PR202_gb11275 [Eleusine coracana subsp. coracana]|uniref:Uncharacterized protein n=1 Tax=Eleusine coracana subsp. coracana TaxID=191504 RepID=A0AAV5EN17_ELECO|nr:hypothetical protein QOZ80_3BG0265060 [Eleusine coracana subsp. coracana]GJN23611.1 hypothetical protein PR202_gb11275 [Eleusine coracana subsp. coracana]
MACTLQQHRIKAMTPTWLLVKVTSVPPRDGGAKRSYPAPAYSPFFLSPSAWQNAQDEKKSKDAGGLPESPRISCMGQVKGRRKRECSSTRPRERDSGHGGVLATLVPGLFGRRGNGRASSSRACSKVRDVPRGQGTASASGSSHGGGSVANAAVGVLDPPLPVVRRPARGGDDAPCLWERRRGGCKVLAGLRLPYITTESS